MRGDGGAAGEGDLLVNESFNNNMKYGDLIHY